MKLETLMGRNSATWVHILHNSRFLKGLIRCDFSLFLLINSRLIFYSGMSVAYKLIFMAHFFNFSKLIFSTSCVTYGLRTHKNVFDSRKLLPQKCILSWQFLINLPFSIQFVTMFLLDGVNLCGMNFGLFFPVLLHLSLDALKFESHLCTARLELLPQFNILPLGF